jgi:nicotinate-nucleotide--dimethylbenzimidazole phosphoribosyltransferase
VRIQLKQPVEVKSLVLTRPDRIVLDLYPKAGAAEPQPLPTPELLPEEEPPAPVVAEAPPEIAAEPEAAPEPEPEPGLPDDEEGEEPLVLELPEAAPAEAEVGEAAPEAEGEPAEAGEEAAAAPAQPGDESAPGATEPAETARTPAAPTTPAAPAPSGSRFGSPFALGATAVVLLVLFVWLRRRLRASERPRLPIPEEEPSPFEPPARAVAVGEEAESGESVFDVEPEALAPAREEVPTLRPPVGTGLDAEDEAERRIAHVEKRIEELAEAKDRLERQIAAQTEELRVQRAAIARTQRVLRSIAPKGDEEPSEPLVRG